MVTKKAYIRTIEAVVAIVLLLFASYLVTPKELLNPRATPYVVESAQKYVLSQATNNESLRKIIIDYSDTGLANRSLNGIIENRLPAGYKYSSVICTNPDCVTLPELQTSVYTNDILITGTETGTGKQVLRLVRVWFWREG